MRLLIDADGLIKLNRAGVLSQVTASFACLVPRAVFDEVVTEGKARHYEDATAIEAAGLGKKEDFLKAAQNGRALIADIDPQARSLEGYLFPDTYRFTRTQSVQDMVLAMVHRFRQEAQSLGF